MLFYKTSNKFLKTNNEEIGVLNIIKHNHLWIRNHLMKWRRKASLKLVSCMQVGEAENETWL